ncbi:TRAP transporter small permease subunit [Gammaproteobacteria bacterium]|nr:TRAP transporter small permease subunit [Gammaproteobacteria bacterium]
MQLPSTAISRRIDPLITWVGESISWIWLLLLFTIVFNVVMRYAFGEGRIELEEIQWHLYSTGFLLGIGYTFQVDGHVRVDVVHERLSPRAQGWLELYGILLCVLPFTALILIFSAPFIASSYALSEVSVSPGGLPFRWLIKSMLFIGFALLLLAIVSRFSRVWSFLFLSPAGGRHESQ